MNPRWQQLALSQRTPAIQAKLALGRGDDPHEQEADRAADAVVRGDRPGPLSALSSPTALDRKCAGCGAGPAECETCDEDPIQAKTKANASADELGPSPEFEHRLDATIGGGRALPDDPRRMLEASFGASFEHLRVHTDGRAAELTRQINARAFTRGADLYFGPGEFEPHSARGQHLLAHEVAHSVQQGAATSDAVQRQDREVPELRSILFRTSAALQRAYGRGTVDISRDTGSLGSKILIQQALIYIDHERYALGSPDGQFGDDTDAALRRFQADAGLSPSARVGPDTLRALDDAVVARDRASTDSGMHPGGGARDIHFGDYPDTYISQIDVDLTSLQVTLTWAGPTASSRATGPFHCSPGRGVTGNVCHDCDDVGTSTSTGTNCTPKGSFVVNHRAQALPSYPEALFPTFFSRPGIAFHYYPSVPGHPASHGCVRLDLYPAMLIHANVIIGTTSVDVGGTWSRHWQDALSCGARDAERGLRRRGRDLWQRGRDLWDDIF